MSEANYLTPNQFQLEVGSVKSNLQNFFKGTQIALNKFLKPAINATAPFRGMAVSAKTKNPEVGPATTNILKSISEGKILSLTDFHGNGLRLKVMWFNSINICKIKIDSFRKFPKCEIFSSKYSFYKDITKVDGFNPICKLRRKVYFYEKIDKIKKYRKQYEENRRDSDLNFKLACKLRSRTNKALKSQNY